MLQVRMEIIFNVFNIIYIFIFKAFDTIVRNFLFSFLNFHDNFISLIWIVLNYIHSRNKNIWSPFWPLYPYHVGNYAGLPTLDVSLCMLFQRRSSPISMMTRDYRCTDKGPRNQNSKICWWRLFSEVTWTALLGTSPLSDTIREVFQLKKHTLPGIKN